MGSDTRCLDTSIKTLILPDHYEYLYNNLVLCRVSIHLDTPIFNTVLKVYYIRVPQ
jgi:hypothetical protein